MPLQLVFHGSKEASHVFHMRCAVEALARAVTRAHQAVTKQKNAAPGTRYTRREALEAAVLKRAEVFAIGQSE